jgi:fermentation-respiration switch protein FrsA (DUF1100 family)
LVHFLSYPKRFTGELTHRVDEEKGLLVGTEVLERTPVAIPLSDGLALQGDLSLHPQAKGIVILTHGYTWTREGDLKYAKIFYSLGYSVLMYDLRSHGKNPHKDCTMGYKEGKDLHEIILWVRKTYGEATPIGLHGESLGAAVSLLVLAYQDPLSFVISDSAFASLEELVRYQLKERHLPRCLVPLCSGLLKIGHGYRLKDVSPEKALADSKVPVLVVQGACDTLIPSSHAYRLKAANPSCTLKLFPGCDHTQEVIAYPTEYEMVLKQFLAEHSL